MAIGGIGGALLAGLEGYSQARQREQQDQRARANLELFQQEFRARQAQQQRELEQMNLAGLAAFGGMPTAPQQGSPAPGQVEPTGYMVPSPAGAGMGAPPTQSPPGMTDRFAQPTPSGPTSASGRFGGMSIPARGTAERERLLDRLAIDESGNRNIPQGVVPPGGGYNPSVGRVTGPSTAGGPWQITNTTLRDTPTGQRTGATSAMALPISQQREAANDLIDKRGISPWGPYNAVVRNDPVIRQIMGAAQAPEARQTAAQVVQNIPPQAQGQASLQGMVDMINRVAPNADPATKFGALIHLQQFMAPYQKMQLEAQIRQQTQDFREREFQERIRHDEALERGEKSADTQILTEPGTNQQYVYNKRTREATTLSGEPYTPSGAQKLSGAAGGGKMGRVANITAFKGGQQVFEGSAQYTPHGWVNTATGQPIPEADRVDEVKGAGTGSGGRAGAQVQRQLISGKEVISDLQNAMSLPISSTRGIFGGRTQGPGLVDALKENMAETATPEEDELMQSALSGLFRELSIVVSPVYGGHWAADSFAALGIKPGQTNAVKLYNLARMRQTVDNALEGVENTDWVGKEQKEFAKRMRADIAKAVPFTPQDVIAFRSRADDEQSFSDFVKQHGIGGASQPTQGTHKVGDIIEQGGKKYRVIGGDPNDPDVEEVK